MFFQNSNGTIYKFIKRLYENKFTVTTFDNILLPLTGYIKIHISYCLRNECVYIKELSTTVLRYDRNALALPLYVLDMLLPQTQIQ